MRRWFPSSAKRASGRNSPARRRDSLNRDAASLARLLGRAGPIENARDLPGHPHVRTKVIRSVRNGLNLGAGLLFGNALGEHLREVDRIDHQRREAAVAGHVGDDLTGEGEEHARALDEENRQHVLLRETGNAEDAAIDEFGVEHRLVIVLGFGIQRQHDIEIRVGKRIGIDVHIDVDRRCLVAGLQRTRRTRIFEGKILRILRKDREGGVGRTVAVVVVCHWLFLEGHGNGAAI
ncbi:hypothetical protein RHECNPAF_3340030 [Rhizobium etli CNPAF512]|nr:hypothetical protein RHECNPAF_3340030 [Rhizobium etli CNPAF512]